MKDLKFFSLMLIVVLLAMGCSRTYGNYRTQLESETKVTKRELIENWSDYDIWLFYPRGYRPPQLIAIILDPINDDRKILVGLDWRKVKDQQMWTETVNSNKTGDGDFKVLKDFPVGTSTVKEICGPDNQLYGYAIISTSHFAYTRMVEENTVRFDTLGRAGGS